jgi:methylated-DNA-[protein]-cysteine S-methyltransferase
MEIEIGCTKVVDTPIGRLAVSASEDAVVELAFLLGNTKRLDFVTSAKAEKKVDSAIQWITDYFAGSETDFTGKLDLSGTDFQRAVWSEISKIKHGRTLTYGEIAQRIGRPKASRAVGAAVGANPIPLIVPCHRVMGTGGKITGYSGGDGIPTKRKLLKLEKIEFAE